MRKISKLVVHCTDSEDSLDFGFKDIDEWHRQRGWLSDSGVSCGYHYVIRRDGRIENGRPEMETGAHVRGHNSDSIGIVWVGRNKISRNQLKTLKKLLRTLINRHRLNPLDIWGHTELDPKKTCPNLDMDYLRAMVLFELDEI